MLLRRAPAGALVGYLRPQTQLARALHPLAASKRKSSTVSASQRLNFRASSSNKDSSSNAFTESVTSAYIHLPFCKRKCFYCDFPVEAIGQLTTSPKTNERMTAYIDTLCKEIMLTPTSDDHPPLATVFLGGGTPSLTPLPLLTKLISTLEAKFGFAQDVEISMEADPGTFTPSDLAHYISLGINRLSVGVQSFDQELLEKCGRSHNLDDVYRAIDDVKQSGISTWSLDLISGLPLLTVDNWRHTVEETIKAAPPHVSVYDLQLEEGTPFARWYQPGQAPMPTEDTAADMFTVASRLLRGAGYEHYEISSYAREGHRCRHNQVYWKVDPFYAFGLGAASFLENRRFSRPTRMKDYTAWVDSLPPTPTHLPGHHLPPLSTQELLLETVMLRLRLSDGLDMQYFASQFGSASAELVVKSLQKHARTGLVLGFDGQGKGLMPGRMGEAVRVQLKDPEGLLVSNEILADVFAAFSDGLVEDAIG